MPIAPCLLLFASCYLSIANCLLSLTVPRISIAVKNAIVYFILLVLTSVILGYSIYRISSNKILENATLSLNHNNESVVTQFRTFLNDIQRDISFMSKNPFLYQFISEQSNRGLTNNLSNEFLALLSTNKKYLQLRLVGIEEEGKEIIRAEKFMDGFRLVDQEHLQKKGDRDYFIETIRLPEDSIYYSEINLNQEYGRIAIPMVPTMRMAKPIYLNGKAFGILIVNIDLSYVFDELKKIAGKQFTLALFNDNGFYLIHPDSSKIFGFEFGKTPDIDLLKLDKYGTELKSQQIKENELYSIIHYSYPRANYHLFFSLSADKNMLLSVFNQWKSDLFLLTIIMTLLSLAIAVWWTNRQTKVFKSITSSIINFGKNPENITLQVDRDDEIGDLSKSFLDMANRIKLHLNELEIAKTDAVEANKAKQEFLENMSHEIRNPLQSILGITGMLSQNNPRPDQQVFIDTLKFSSENLLTLVNDILDYRKLIHGQIDLQFQEVGIKEYLDNIIKSHLFDAVNKKIKLNLDLQQQLVSQNFNTDPVRLSQILHNLISNAIRNSPQGKEVVLSLNSQDKTCIEFSIIDQGHGLSEDNIDNILMQKPVTGDSRQLQNVGLGLPIVINLLKLFKSKLNIESRPGKGSRFSFILSTNLTIAAQRFQIMDQSVQFLDAYLESVACIEDDKQNSFFYQEVFKKHGIKTKLFDSPKEFINQKNEKYDLVLTDLHFSETQVGQHLKAIRMHLNEKGLLLLISATDNLNQSLNPEQQLYDASFVKPVTSELLLNELSKLIFQKHFEKPKLDNLYVNYDYQSDKVRKALELMIKEWKEMFERLMESIQKRDVVLFDKVYHKLINAMRTFELSSLQMELDKVRIQMDESKLDLLNVNHKISLPFMFYLKIFQAEVDKLKEVK